MGWRGYEVTEAAQTAAYPCCGHKAQEENAQRVSLISGVGAFLTHQRLFGDETHSCLPTAGAMLYLCHANVLPARHPSAFKPIPHLSWETTWA
jgi:hypothetical protein